MNFNQTIGLLGKFRFGSSNRFYAHKKDTEIQKKKSKKNKNYLNEGKGDPWAGQDKLIASLEFWTNFRPSVLCANFGLAPPIGSEYKKVLFCIKTPEKSHLNAGIGFPWAGQRREKGWPELTLKDPNESELVENLGKDIPIGSKENVK